VDGEVFMGGDPVRNEDVDGVDGLGAHGPSEAGDGNARVTGDGAQVRRGRAAAGAPAEDGDMEVGRVVPENLHARTGGEEGPEPPFRRVLAQRDGGIRRGRPWSPEEEREIGRTGWSSGWRTSIGNLEDQRPR
jgi:hypothetical protein